MFVFASLVLSTAFALAPLAPFDASAAVDSSHRHVRSQDRAVQQLLTRGLNASYTFRHLIARLEGSDVIVYIEQVAGLPRNLDGRMIVVPAAHGQRYIRIQIVTRGAPDDEVAL